MFPLAERMKLVSESITLAVSAKANAMKKAGVDVVGFGAGEPDFDTPAFNKDNGLPYKPEHITTGAGGKHCLYMAFMAVLNPGDEVILPAPYWVSYPEQVKLAGGVTKVI